MRVWLPAVHCSSSTRVGTAVLALVAAPAALRAQAPTTVSGVVTSEAGLPLALASVNIPTLGIGAQTNSQGRYSFVVPGARTLGRTVDLSARLVGYRPGTARVTLVPGTTVTQNFALGSTPLRLSDVVVTGAGTTSSRERLGVTVSSVASDQLVKSAEPNIVNALAQKAPGIEVTSQSGDPGAGSGIILRGLKTIQGNGQPLFVIDGQPIDNSTIVTDASDNGFGYSNRALDINPADILSVDVLKGPSAAALYGLRAANGVILITTRAGQAGATRYQLNTNFAVDDVNRRIPLQTQWGRGFVGVTPVCAPDALCANRSWGAAIPAGTPVYDHFAELFRTGTTVDPTLQVSGGDAQRSFFLSGSTLQQQGVSKGPNSALGRNTFRLRAAQQLTSTLRVGGNVNYTTCRSGPSRRGTTSTGCCSARRGSRPSTTPTRTRPPPASSAAGRCRTPRSRPASASSTAGCGCRTSRGTPTRWGARSATWTSATRPPTGSSSATR